MSGESAGPPRRSTGSPVHAAAPTADRFRAEVARALADGAGPGDLVLRLTRSDVNRLLRDREMPLGDIHFADGVMQFLGVTVQQGGVETSVLELSVQPSQP